MLSLLIIAVVVPAIAILVGKVVPVRPSVKRPVWAVSGLERRLDQVVHKQQIKKEREENTKERIWD